MGEAQEIFRDCQADPVGTRRACGDARPSPARRRCRAGRSLPTSRSSSTTPKRDAAADIDAAVAEAGRSKRHVLVEVGGEWCGWCHRLEDYLKEKKKLNALLERNFVVVKVNYSPENENEEVLSRYPEVAGYPHFFVLDGKGKLLHSQDTAKLEKGKSYHARRFKRFLTRWGPKRSIPSRRRY